MKNKKYIDVYWGIWDSPENEFKKMLIDVKPIKLNSDFIKKRSILPKIPQVKNLQPNGYQTCSAYTNLTDNVFLIKSPIDAKFNINENGEIVRDFVHESWFTERVSSFNNSFCFDLDLGYLFFTDEEELNLTITPAYMHQTSYANNAFLLSVKYDISSWFRPIQFIFHTWENVQNFEIKENEVIAYLSFDTDRPIRLRQFLLNDTIINQARSCMNYKSFKQFTPINKLYEKFRNSGLRQSILKEVKKNLID